MGVIIDVYSDLLGGRRQFEAEDLEDLKYQICERVQGDILWERFYLVVNDNPLSKEYTFQYGDAVKIIPNSRPQPIATATHSGALEEVFPPKRSRVKKVCPTCNASLPKANTFQREERCVYCGCVTEVV